MSELNQPNPNETKDPNASQEQPQMIPTELPKRSSRRTFLFVALGVGGVALLGGAAYAAGNLMNQSQAGGPQAGGSGFVIKGPGGNQTFKSPPIKNAPQIPSSGPDVKGLFLRRQDQSIFVGTGRVQVAIQKDANGQMNSSATNDGPEVEVVVNHDTELYIDKTPITMEAVQAGKEIQQVVEPVASLDEFMANIGKTDTLSAWGQKVGSRLVAKVLLYRSTMFQDGPAGGGK